MTSKRPWSLLSRREKISRKREIQPSPATTQSCLAMMVAEARSDGSIVTAVVTSCVALSSTRACSRIASMRLLFQAGNDLFRGLGQKRFIIQLAFCVDQHFFVLFELFL